ncbi:uncharacterized protein [Physcomitrium patens]|uniref:uncharacterized protein n=1 Tax=Physcomitrium patens TaxID=3218 RepID=UPI003CCCF53B
MLCNLKPVLPVSGHRGQNKQIRFNCRRGSVVALWTDDRHYSVYDVDAISRTRRRQSSLRPARSHHGEVPAHELRLLQPRLGASEFRMEERNVSCRACELRYGGAFAEGVWPWPVVVDVYIYLYLYLSASGKGDACEEDGGDKPESELLI